MSGVMKTGLGLAGTAGSCCAVGVPMVMVKQGSVDGNTSLVNSQGLSQISIEECTDISQKEKINFGDQSGSSICGNSGNEQDQTKKQKVNELFRSIGSNELPGSKIINLNTQVYCRQQDTQSETSDEEDPPGFPLGENKNQDCNGTVYLGADSTSKDIFVKNKKDNQHPSTSEIGLCINNCGKKSEAFEVMKNQQIVEEESGNGKKVDFYKK